MRPEKPQADQNLCKSLEYSMSVKLLTVHNLEFLSLKGCCTATSESTCMLKCHNVGNLMPRFIYDCLFREFSYQYLHSLLMVYIVVK